MTALAFAGLCLPAFAQDRPQDLLRLFSPVPVTQPAPVTAAPSVRAALDEPPVIRGDVANEAPVTSTPDPAPADGAWSVAPPEPAAAPFQPVR